MCQYPLCVRSPFHPPLITSFNPSLSTFPLVWEGVYRMETGVASLNYLSLGVGFIIGLQICAPLIDRVCIEPSSLPTDLPHYNYYYSRES